MKLIPPSKRTFAQEEAIVRAAHKARQVAEKDRRQHPLFRALPPQANTDPAMLQVHPAPADVADTGSDGAL